MSKDTKGNYQNYWDRNISKWGDLYLNISHGHESLNGNPVITWLYNRIVVPYEASLMKVRYQKTIAFLDEYITKETVLNDVGCGTGIFTVEALNRGAKVNAIDLSDESLKVTRQNVSKRLPAKADDVTYMQADGQFDKLPPSNLSLCVGVLPYVTDSKTFLKHLLENTETAFVQFTDKHRFSNRVRRLFPFLNVRKLQFQSVQEIVDAAEKIGFSVMHIENFATGKLVVLGKNAT